MWFYSGLPWNDPGSDWFTCPDGWSQSVMVMYLFRDGLSMACQYGLHNWILASVLWIVHSFTRWTLQWFWTVMKSEFHSWNACLYIPLKIVVSMYNHSSTRFPYISVNRHCGIYSTSLGTDSQCAWSFPGLGGVNMRMFGLLVTSSRIKIIYGHLDDCSLLSFLPE